MGVLGLTPFLHKTCPEVIKQLPDRLRGLSGKTIVIDGTLVTQRFHFAQAPHPYRHVLGWYRLARELNEAKVSAICVFDGKERSFAKAPEVERRRETRRLAVARGLLENDRFERLRKLSDVLHKFRDLDVVARERAMGLLRQLSLEDDTPLTAMIKPSAILSDATRAEKYVEMITSHLPDSIPGLSSDDEREALYSLGKEEPPLSSMTMVSAAERELESDFLSPNELPSLGGPTVAETEEPDDVASLDAIAFEQSLEDSALLSSDQHLPQGAEKICPNGPPQHDDGSAFREVEATVQDVFPSPEAQSDSESLDGPSYGPSILPQDDEDVNATFASLYFDFRRSISKLALLTACETSALTPSVSTGPSDPDAQTENVMTKAQYRLTLEEKLFWEHLLSSPSIIMDSSEEEFSSAVETLVNLTHTSNVMSESYERRTNPPTARTYEESRGIIQAMGLPCVDSVGPFEAEALASSIVLSGLADYVASEDTDVLVYDAPLIRNLTNRQSPLTILSGSDIRMVLELDRASFIDFALLLGTDFSQRIKRVGPARALKFIKAHGSIERVVELETKYTLQVPQDVYLAQVEVARMVFQTLPPIPEKSRLEQGSIDEAAVVEILERYGLGRALMSSDWDYGAALEGNYFQDNPSAF